MRVRQGRSSARQLARGQRGQAMVYMAIVAAVLVGVLYATYDLAYLTTAKIQSQNAADAAALAAASVKVSIHNTRTLAYAAMTAEATIARLKLAKSLAILGEQPPVPGQPYAALAQFQQELKEAHAHITKLQELWTTLKAYNHWVAQVGPQVVADAARIGYAANIANMNENAGPGASANQANLHLLDGDLNLVENGGTFQSGQFIGGVNYRSESAGPSGDAGKTFVGVEPDFAPLGGAFLGAGGPVPLPALAAAGPVPSSDIARTDPGDGDLSVGGFGMPWYSPRLFAIGGVHGFPHALLH